MVRSIQMVSVVVPTYNERETLPHLVRAIDRHLSYDYEIIVVDDGSPDGTAQVAEELALEYPLRVLQRGAKLGLGSAYRAGFRAARGDAVFEMDADLSHDPRYMPGLIEAIEQGAGLAIGSRYVYGGRINNWGSYRKFVSGVGNGLARHVLGIPARDCTSGYRCYAADWKHLVTGTRSDGYAFQVEALYLAKRLGAPISEVPIVFENRAIGKSKLGAGEFGKFLATIGRLRIAGAPSLPALPAPAPVTAGPVVHDQTPSPQAPTAPAAAKELSQG